MPKISKVYVGVDVSKDNLDIHIFPANQQLKMENSSTGLINFKNILRKYKVGQIVCESSGGYEHLMIKTLRKAKYKVWLVEPIRIKAFIASEGIKFKNDVIDAKMIALFASQKTNSYDCYQSSESETTLKNWVKRRSDLVDIMLMEKRRLKHPEQIICKQDIIDHINFIKLQIQKIDKEINRVINNNNMLKKRAEIISSIPGIGPITTSSLLADIPELGSIENKQAAALLGVAPYIQQSGKSKGIGFIKCGRFEPRRKIYMASLTAIRFNQTINDFYKKLINAGKKPKCAIIAAANKLIRIINAMLKNETMWKENYAGI